MSDTPTLLKVDHRTGATTFGSSGQQLPLSPGWRWIAPIDSFRHGYAVTNERGDVLERHLALMARGEPRPRPPGGRYTRFGESGACEMLAVDLHSISEVGFWMRFEAFGRHNREAVARLCRAVVDHFDTVNGQRDFVHPVVTIHTSGRLYEHCGVVRFARFDVVDWLHADGARLLSEEPLA